MKKKLVIICTLILMIGIGVAIFIFANKKEMTDAIRFKQEYESQNGVVNASGKQMRTLNIDSENPMIYKEASDIVSMMENNETFIVYFGFKTCPWCRSVLPTLLEVANNQSLARIYYVDVLDIRDTLKLNEEGKIETTKSGSEGYYKLLEKLGDLLEEYTLTDSNGKEVSTGEKRIFAPNIVAVVDGQAKKLTTGISAEQTDGYMQLTDSMKVDMKSQIEEVLKVIGEHEQCPIDAAC